MTTEEDSMPFMFGVFAGAGAVALAAYAAYKIWVWRHL